MSLKEFWIANRHKITPVLKVAKRCIADVVDLKENPKVMDFVSLGFSFKENYDIVYRLNDPYNYFSGRGWKLIENPAIAGIIFNLIETNVKVPSPITASESGAAFEATVNGVRFGWVHYDESLEKVYVHNDNANDYKKIISDMFWAAHPKKHVVMGMADASLDQTINIHLWDEDWEKSPVYHSPRVDKYSQEIVDYLHDGVYRSILFYGPPGSGKSNLIRGICVKLGLKTIRVKDMSEISADVIAEVINVFNPDAIILEDVDSASVKDTSDLLDKMENFNKSQKLTFGTANRVASLEDSLLRPGRFDEVIEINNLEPEVIQKMVGDDEEVMNMVKDYPAAFIGELMKRIKTKGRDEALANMRDLKARLKKIKRNNYELDDEEDDSSMKKSSMIDDNDEDEEDES